MCPKKPHRRCLLDEIRNEQEGHDSSAALNILLTAVRWRADSPILPPALKLCLAEGLGVWQGQGLEYSTTTGRRHDDFHRKQYC